MVQHLDKVCTMIGRTIERYRVVEELGQGGMGVVYMARDTLLERFVALKVLPPGKCSDPERRRRFLREAKSASALNHPGIVAIHDVLTVDGQDVLVMELVQGETLERLLARKRLVLGEALVLGIEIAEALSRAHTAGIVHRDLKPSNVMVTSDGIKILDFGLAKLTDAPFPDGEAPTLAPGESGLTEERVVLGTVGWMSPEQASGEPVDARSDIFAFGVVLYQMMTGHHPFRRGTTVETLAAIRSEDPEPPTKTDPTLPPEAERAVLRCLDKNPSRRWQSISDLAKVLEDLKEDSASGNKVLVDRAARGRKFPLSLMAAIAAVAVVGVLTVLLLLGREPAAARPLELRRLTYDAGISYAPAISPDGNLVAFSSDRVGDGSMDIWVRHINQPEPTRLTDHPSDDGMPRFSPDGSRVVLRSERQGGGIFVINALGGGLRRIADRGIFPRFSVDGKQVFFVEDPDWAPTGLRRMYKVDVNGGMPEVLVPGWGVWAPPGSAGPVISPDGRLLLFPGAPLDDPIRHDWWVAPINGGAPSSSGALKNLPTEDGVQFPSVWLPRQLLFVAGTTIEGINLYSARISDDGNISGPARPLTAGPGMTWLPTVSADGRIALDRFQFIVHLWEVVLDGTTGRAIGPPRRITDDASPKFSFSVTRDGDLLAYSSYAGSPHNRRAEIRLQNRASDEESTVVSLDAVTTSLHARLNGDGSLLSWRNRSERGWASWVAPTDDPIGRMLCENCVVVDFFSDGTEALVDLGRRLSRLRIADGRETPVMEFEDRVILDADLSWDDRWLAILTGDPDGTVAISIGSLGPTLNATDDWIEISGRESWVGAPRWSPDGSILYYLSDRDDYICVWARTLDPETMQPVGDAFPVAHAHISSKRMLPLQKTMWTLAVGGDRLVFNASDATGDVYTAQLEPE